MGARNRKGLEQLCRYIARPPLAKERVEALPGGRVRIALKRAWSDGTTALELSRLPRTLGDVSARIDDPNGAGLKLRRWPRRRCWPR